MSVEDFIRKIEDEFEDIPKGVITPEALIEDFIEVNSLNIMIVTLVFEYDYDQKVAFEDIKKANTFHDLHALIKK